MNQRNLNYLFATIILISFLQITLSSPIDGTFTLQHTNSNLIYYAWQPIDLIMIISFVSIPMWGIFIIAYREFTPRGQAQKLARLKNKFESEAGFK